MFPLYLDGEQALSQGSLALNTSRRPNFSPGFIAGLTESLGVQPTPPHGFPQDVTPEDAFNYVYAIINSPSYRVRYNEFLKSDFPRIPFPADLAFFRELARCGCDLVALHLLESPTLTYPISTYAGPTSPVVSRVGWLDGTIWLDAAAAANGYATIPGTIGFLGVPKIVWEFRVGGFQVCQKWLKDRKGYTLTKADIEHYQKIVTAVTATIPLTEEIDQIIEQHGGWEGGFARNPKPATKALMDSAEMTEPLTLPPSRSRVLSEYTSLPYLAKVAESKPPHYGEVGKASGRGSNVSLEDLDRDEVMCEIRRTFNDNRSKEREEAITLLSREIGFTRTGKRIRETLDNALRTAVRRGILSNERGTLQLFVRSVEDYDRAFLKDQFLASLDGRQWTVRDEAVRQFARWMGFRRTGASIDILVRSLINGLLREGRLESDGSQLRRVG